MNCYNRLNLHHSFNTSDVTYSILSDVEPICGMDYRSSGNIEVLVAGNYSLTASPSNVKFDIYQDKGMNEKIATYPLPASAGGMVYLKEEGEYFIAVQEADKPFTVTFQGPLAMSW